jgi:hypothetical protein
MIMQAIDIVMLIFYTVDVLALSNDKSPALFNGLAVLK